MARYISKPFEYLENVVGVEINFNKVFYKPEKIKSVQEVSLSLEKIQRELESLEKIFVK